MSTETQSTPAAAPAPAATPAATTVPAANPIQQVPAAQPAATPAATPAVEPKQGEAKGEVTEGVFGVATTYQSTGNSNLDTALKWAGGLGLDIDASPEMQAATTGNFAPLRALLASKEVPGSEAYIALAEAGYKEAVAAHQEKTSAIQALVVDVAGGEAEWGEVFNWAAENADDAEKEQINAALEQGGFVAEAVASRLVHNYRAQSGVSVPPKADPAKPTAGAGNSAATNGPLSPADYGKAVQDLRLKLKGQPIETSSEYRALQQRRMSFRG